MVGIKGKRMCICMCTCLLNKTQRSSEEVGNVCVCVRLQVECREWRESGEWVPSQMVRACGVSSCSGITLTFVQRAGHTPRFFRSA